MKAPKKTINVSVNPTKEAIERISSVRLIRGYDDSRIKKQFAKLDGCAILYPETHLMPLDAGVRTKNVIDLFLESDGTEFNILTVSTDVCILAHDYGKHKKCKVKLSYQDKPSTLAKVFKKFNEFFTYNAKVNEDLDSIWHE